MNDQFIHEQAGRLADRLKSEAGDPSARVDRAFRLAFGRPASESEVMEAWSKIVGDFIAAHSSPVALREGVLYVRVLQPTLHYELEQVAKIDILRKLKQRFGAKIIRDVRFRVG